MLNHTERLREIADQATALMVRQYPDRIRQVILFGSVALDRANADSDVDLCVVVPSFRDLVNLAFQLELREYLLKNGFKVGPNAGEVQLTCLSQADMKENYEFRGLMYPFIENIKRGRVLYG